MGTWVTCKKYGTTPDGECVEIFSLCHQDLTIRILTYGATVASIEMADRHGTSRNVVLGCRDLAGYISDEAYFGATIGRFANRIAGGSFMLDGTRYQLDCNKASNALHGGRIGFNRVVWRAQANENPAAVTLSHRSLDGEGGYPGTLDVSVTYTLSIKKTLSIDYIATTDRPTVLNLTNHNYFNLAGEASGDIYDHELMIAADAFLAVNEALIPTGQRLDVSGTPFDFRMPVPVGARLRIADTQLLRGRGYDHNFVLRSKVSNLKQAARLRDPSSGRVLEIFTTEPGIQFYSGNFLDGTQVGSSGSVYRQGDGLCLETQHFPDSPNHPEFPSTVLRPGETFRSTTVLRFLID